MNADNIISPLLQNSLRARLTLLYILFIILTAVSGILFETAAALILLVLWTALFFLISVYYIPALCSKMRCKITMSGIILKKGLLLSKTAIIDYGSIEYCILIITPSDRIYGLCSLIILCSGNHEIIYGLPIFTGESLCSKIRRRVDERK